MAVEKHFAYTIVRWPEIRAYWLNFLLHFITMPFVAAVIVLFWSYAYQGQTSIGGFSLNEMIAYLVIAYFVGVSTRYANESNIVEESIVKGTISSSLTRPVEFWKARFFTRLADLLLRGVMISMVGIGFTLYWLGFYPPPLVLSGVLALCLLSFAANFFLYHSIGLISFWLERTWGIRLAVQWTQVLLSGGLFPITLFPIAFQRALHYSPFPHMLYAPAAALAGKLAAAQLLESILILSAWTIALYLLQKTLWKKGLERYDAKG